MAGAMLCQATEESVLCPHLVPRLFRLQKGNEAQRRGGPVLGCQAWSQAAGA